MIISCDIYINSYIDTVSHSGHKKCHRFKIASEKLCDSMGLICDPTRQKLTRNHWATKGYFAFEILHPCQLKVSTRYS